MRTDRHQEKTAAEMTATTKIGNMTRDPNKFYRLVERERPNQNIDYTSPLDEAIDSGEWQIASTDRKVTGHGRLVLLECPLEEEMARQKEAADAALEHQRPGAMVQDDRVAKQWETRETGAAMSIKQLSQSVAHVQETGPDK